ncbi:MAG: DinB family protein [Flavobacteriaceae bacterium]|nr:DinB family protein [Flavobacteriaceae bacterium]
MISAITHNLERGIKLLSAINDSQYDDSSVAPYYSSIGIHMRHILDVFDCIFEGLETKKVDLSARKRNELAEKKVSFGLVYFDEVIAKLENLKSENLDVVVEVKDDLGLGVVTANYTLASALIQAHSHAIHHFASIGYIISQLGINLPDADFGYNPTTPRDKILND